MDALQRVPHVCHGLLRPNRAGLGQLTLEDAVGIRRDDDIGLLGVRLVADAVEIGVTRS